MMSLNAHTWLRPPYSVPHVHYKSKPELVLWQRVFLIIGLIVTPLLIPTILTINNATPVLEHLSPIKLTVENLNFLRITLIILAFTNLLYTLRQAFRMAIVLTILPFIVLHVARALQPTAYHFDGYLVNIITPYTIDLVVILTIFYAVTLSFLQPKIKSHSKLVARTILVATGGQVCIAALWPFAFSAQSLLLVNVISILAVFVPFLPAVYWLLMPLQKRIKRLSIESTVLDIDSLAQLISQLDNHYPEVKPQQKNKTRQAMIASEDITTGESFALVFIAIILILVISFLMDFDPTSLP